MYYRYYHNEFEKKYHEQIIRKIYLSYKRSY